MTTRRTFLQLLLAMSVAPSMVLAAPKPPHIINITIKSDSGMVDARWIEERLMLRNFSD
jgi:hypothetical protein